MKEYKTTKAQRDRAAAYYEKNKDKVRARVSAKYHDRPFGSCGYGGCKNVARIRVYSLCPTHDRLYFGKAQFYAITTVEDAHHEEL